MRTKARIVYVTGKLSYVGALAFAANTREFKPYLLCESDHSGRRKRSGHSGKQYFVVRIVDGKEKGFKTEVVSIDKLIEVQTG